MRLDELTWPEIDRHGPRRLVLAVPIGSCEQHGPHLPFGTDTIIADALARGLAAAEPDVVVAPPLAVTASGEHAGFPGTLSLGTAVTTAVLVELARSADWAAGLVLVNGHGGNADAVAAAVATIRREGRNVLAWWPTSDPEPARATPADVHAGHVETSLLLALRPELVARDRARGREHGAARRPDAGPAHRRRGGRQPATVCSATRGLPHWTPAAGSSTGSTTDLVAATRAAPRPLDATMTRYRLDSSNRTVGDGTTVLGGSPLRLFRLTDGGRAEYDRIAAGDHVAPSTLTERLVAAGAIHPLVDRAVPHTFSLADVTVVIPTHDTEAARVYELLQHCADTAGVVFVDDGSAEPITGVRGANVVRLRHNSGPAAARNAGFRAVQTPLVAFVDSDVDLHAGWLSDLFGHFDDDPSVSSPPGWRAARPCTAPTRTSPATRSSTRPLDLGPEPAPIVPGTRVSYVPGATLVVRTAALQQIDGFDADLHVGEDVDAVWRLTEAGWVGRYDPSVVVEHHPRRDWGALVRQRISYGESAAALAATHGAAVAPVRMSPWTLAAWGLAAAGELGVALALAGGTAVALVPKLRGVPAQESMGLALRGHLAAGGSLAAATRRTWFPVAVVAALGSRRARRVARRLARPGPRERGTGPAPRRPGVLRRCLEGRSRSSSAHPAAARAQRLAGAGTTRRRRVDRPVTLRLEVAPAWRTDVDAAAAALSAAGPLVPVVKGNGYGFGRATIGGDRR